MGLINWFSIVVALGMYPPLSYKILKGRTSQNLATFTLWVLLDLAAAISVFVQGGSWYLPGAYALGGATIIFSLLIVRTWSWGKFETTIFGLVVLCAIGWIISGPKVATILSTIGVVMAGLPQLKDALNHPEKLPLLEYFGFTMASALATLGAKSWTVEERLYPAACVILCGTIVLVCLPQRFRYLHDEVFGW